MMGETKNVEGKDAAKAVADVDGAQAEATVKVEVVAEQMTSPDASRQYRWKFASTGSRMITVSMGKIATTLTPHQVNEFERRHMRQ